MKIKQLEKELLKIYRKIKDNEPIAERIASEVHKSNKLSAINLYHYLILRSFDLRKVHDELSDMGISSLRSAEGYVMSNLFNVIKLVKLFLGSSLKNLPNPDLFGYKKSKKIIKKNAKKLFNPNQKGRSTEIMVTLPTEAAKNKKLIRKLAVAGMQIARINLSHDNMEVWEKMIRNIKDVRKSTNKNIQIYMDLAGPKIRTSEIKVQSKNGEIKNSIRLEVGDRLILTKKKSLGKKVNHQINGKTLGIPEVGVLLPSIIDDIKIGNDVFFDDGMIKAAARSKKKDQIELIITEAYKSKLSSHKGINLPQTKLNLPSLTKRDIKLLPFVYKHADIVGYSFVRNAEDVQKLYKELRKAKRSDLGVVFKIENQEAFENLPLILFEGMKRNKIGVMIARGDLAVEIGFERISEVQNEILWFCEAAHIPVIWATQVLENLAKKGNATRAEITDAAQSAQADCVMLNKGAHITEAVRTLKHILVKMEAHVFKKKDEMRPLHTAKYALDKV